MHLDVAFFSSDDCSFVAIILIDFFHRVPKIYFCTRTHKQLAQVVNEMRRTAYKDAKWVSVGWYLKNYSFCFQIPGSWPIHYIKVDFIHFNLIEKLLLVIDTYRNIDVSIFSNRIINYLKLMSWEFYWTKKAPLPPTNYGKIVFTRIIWVKLENLQERSLFF